MTKLNRLIFAKQYEAASENDRKKKNMACFKGYWEELKDELKPMVEEPVKAAETKPNKPTGKSRGKK